MKWPKSGWHIAAEKWQKAAEQWEAAYRNQELLVQELKQLNMGLAQDRQDRLKERLVSRDWPA